MKIKENGLRINHLNCSILLVALLLLIGCKDDKRVISILGITKDPIQNTPVEGVTITLLSQKTTTGTFSYNFVEEATTQSNAQGEFFFNFTFSYNVAFKLEMVKENYFSSTEVFEIEAIPDDDHYFGEFDLYPEATIRFHLLNQNPFNAADNVQYRILNWDVACDGCCPYIFRGFTGYIIDETFECRVYGNQEYEIEFIVTKNTHSTFPKRVVNCEAFTTTDVELLF
ncbi:MAG: hypothetical protein K9H64_00765 [Bacteroidales bacterium]|nr:hypothetical protein [Bacteroidales bacterium]MCF8457563.1 hypothetical protein [Bacteroidales bacterium]